MRLLVTCAVFTGICLFPFTQSAVAQAEQTYLRFTVLALTDDIDVRREFENQLVIRLQESRYDAVVSFNLIPDTARMDPSRVRTQLLAAGVDALLILRPLEIGEDTPLTPQLLQMNPGEFASAANFISANRGGEFGPRTVVQIGGFLLEREASRLFWHGVIWLDDTVETEQNRIDKIVDLVQFNLDNSRSALRAQLGLPPLQNN